MSSDAAYLTFSRDGATQRVELDRDRIVIGRNKDGCDIVFPDPSVSRVHCAIERVEDGWHLCDQESRNGTYINQKRIVRQKLEDGDGISFDQQSLHGMTFHARSDRIVFDDRDSDIKNSIVDAALNLDEIHGLDPGTTTISAEPRSAPGRGLIHDSGVAGSGGGARAIRLFSQMGEALLGSSDRDQMLNRVLELTFQHLPAVQRGAVCLYDEDADTIVPTATRQGNVSAPIRISRSITNEVIKEKRAVLARDTWDDARFSHSESIVQMNIRSAMCAPMYHEGHVLGLIYVDSQSGRLTFTEQDLEVLTSLAVYAAVGVQQSKLRAEIEREKRIRDRLARYSSPVVVDQIVESEVGGEGLSEAQEKEVTVLFADLQGFTTMSEGMEPARIAQVLNRVFERMTEVIFRNAGTLDKFIGDGIMAIFGAPLEQPDHAVRAVRSALEMQEVLHALNREEGFDPPIDMRIGMNSGIVVAGEIGAPDRRDYSVIGDAVNVASRLESSVARAGEVIVGPITHEMAKEVFNFEPLDEIHLKGKQQSVRPYRVISSKVGPGGTAEAVETNEIRETP